MLNVGVTRAQLNAPANWGCRQLPVKHNRPVFGIEKAPDLTVICFASFILSSGASTSASCLHWPFWGLAGLQVYMFRLHVNRIPTRFRQNLICLGLTVHTVFSKSDPNGMFELGLNKPMIFLLCPGSAVLYCFCLCH